MKQERALRPFRKMDGTSSENPALRLLRDESGALWLSPGPSLSITQTGSMPRVESAAPRPAAQPAAVRATPHCRFHCASCESILLIPHERMGLPFGQPFLRRIQARSIASVCGACGHVATFSLFRGSVGYDTRHTQITAQAAGHTVLLDWLKCDEPTCMYSVPLFVVHEQPLSVDEARDLAEAWDWSGLTCQAMHPVLAPTWFFDRKPHQFPEPIH